MYELATNSRIVSRVQVKAKNNWVSTSIIIINFQDNTNLDSLAAQLELLTNFSSAKLITCIFVASKEKVNKLFAIVIIGKNLSGRNLRAKCYLRKFSFLSNFDFPSLEIL